MLKLLEKVSFLNSAKGREINVQLFVYQLQDTDNSTVFISDPSVLPLLCRGCEK